MYISAANNEVYSKTKIIDMQLLIFHEYDNLQLNLVGHLGAIISVSWGTMNGVPFPYVE